MKYVGTILFIVTSPAWAPIMLAMWLLFQVYQKIKEDFVEAHNMLWKEDK